MIYIDKTKFTVDGVDVYPDHESKTQFWYIPGTIRLAERNKKKVLSYLWYTDSETDSDGTGFLNFEVNTAISPETRDKILSTLASSLSVDRNKISLSTVTYHSGNVNFSVLGPVAAQAADLKTDASVLYQSKEQLVWSAGSSSLVGDNSAVCSVKFTKEGKLAAAMREAILSGSNSIAALYKLEFLAMRPSVTFKVQGTLEKTVKDFQASIGASIPLEAFVLDLGIQGQWQRIMSKTDLKIEVVNFTGEEQEGLKWAQQVLLDYVLKNFFEVQLGQKEGAWSPLSEKPEVQEAVEKAKDTEEVAQEKVEDDGKKGEEGEKAVKEIVKAATTFIPKVNVRAAYYDGKQVNTIDFLYSEKKAKSYPVLPQALVLEGLKDPKSYVTLVNRSQIPFGLPYNVTISIPEDADRTKVGLQTVNVQARYPAAIPKDRQSTQNLTSNAGKTTGPNPFPFQYDSKGSADVEYSADFVFKPSDDWQADSFQYALTGKSDKGLIVAMPESVVEFTTLDVRLGEDFVWDQADQAVVTLTSGKWSGEKRVVFQNGRENPQTLKIRSDAKLKAATIAYKVELRKGSRTLYSYGPETVIDKQITVHDRFAGHIPVFFTAAFADDSVNVTLSYEDGDFVWEDQFELDKGQKKAQRIIPTLKEFRRPSELKAKYEVTSDEGNTFSKPIQGGQTVSVKLAAS